MAVLPPAPVPTTMASNIFDGIELLLALREPRVLGIVGMRAGRHRRPRNLQAGIAETLETNLGGVIADHCVVAHHLEERPPTLGRRSELGFVRELFEQTVLLFRRAVQEVVLVLRLAARVHPVETA